MDAKARKVLNGLTKLGGEQEVFDLSIAIKMTEDAVQTHLNALSEAGAVSCRRDDSGKELWSVASAQPSPEPEAKEPAPDKKRVKATAAGPDDRFDEFIVDSKAAAPSPSPAPIPPEPADFDSFEPAGHAPDARPAENIQEAETEFDSKPPKREKRAKIDADAEFIAEDEKPAKRKASGDKPPKESKAERELSAGPDDHFDEFAERVQSKPNLPLPLMAGAAVLVLVVVIFIVGGGGGRAKKFEGFKNEIKSEIIPIMLDSLKATKDDIAALRAENDKLSARVKSLETELKKAASQNADKKPAAAENKQAAGNKPKTGNKR